METKSDNQGRERLTVELDRTEFRNLKHFAVDQRLTASEIVRTAVSDFLKAKAKTTSRFNRSDGQD
jgi:hypothetical protein